MMPPNSPQQDPAAVGRASELLALAARCEAATGPDRDLDAAIALALKWENCIPCDFNGIKARMGGILNAPQWTASLDAAMTLVPEGWRLACFGRHRRGFWQATLVDEGDTEPLPSADAATPALALCAASLKARAAQGQPS